VSVAGEQVEVAAGARQTYEELARERRLRLVGPEDDMWATFADRAEPYAIVVDGEIAGCCSMDEAHLLHAFFLRDRYQEGASDLFGEVVERLAVAASAASTVDPLFLSLSLEAGARAETVALLFDHPAVASHPTLIDVRVATVADHAAAVAHNRESTGAPLSFLEPYLTGVIERQELYLVETRGRIVATGECRVDQRTQGYAHLGMVVEPDSRSQGLGTRLLQTLTEISIAADLVPLCSTEPDNLAARRAIHRCGFRSRHRVFRLSFSSR
jgi:predicted GNAT family acetyltransferase